MMGKKRPVRTSRDEILGDFWTWSLIGSEKGVKDIQGVSWSTELPFIWDGSMGRKVHLRGVKVKFWIGGGLLCRLRYKMTGRQPALEGSWERGHYQCPAGVGAMLKMLLLIWWGLKALAPPPSREERGGQPHASMESVLPGWVARRVPWAAGEGSASLLHGCRVALGLMKILGISNFSSGAASGCYRGLMQRCEGPSDLTLFRHFIGFKACTPRKRNPPRLPYPGNLVQRNPGSTWLSEVLVIHKLLK